jgi:hypothetical protein
VTDSGGSTLVALHYCRYLLDMHGFRNAKVSGKAPSRRHLRSLPRSRAWALLAGLLAALGLVVGSQTRQAFAVTGDVSTVVGNGSAFGGFLDIQGTAVDSSGNVYVADFYSFEQLQNSIYKISPASTPSRLVGYNPAVVLDSPRSVAAGLNGDLYVADGHKILKVASTGAVSTFAGSGSQGSADGPGASAAFNSPRGSQSTM